MFMLFRVILGLSHSCFRVYLGLYSVDFLVYNAVITCKVLYGLETLEPTESAGRLLDSFQLKGFRLLKLHTSFIQRRNSNEYVFRRANEILNAPAEGTERKIKPLTEVLQERKLKLLGHVLRRDRQHPLHQSTFSSSLALPRETEHRRVGRPRQSWCHGRLKTWRELGTSFKTKIIPDLTFLFEDKTNVLGKESSDEPIARSRHSIEVKAELV